MPGLWDKAKVLSGLRMDQEYEPGTPFILYGMKTAGIVPADVLPEGRGDGREVSKTVMLTQEVTPDGDGGWTPVPDTEKVVGTLAGPIAAMQAEAGDDDFPAVVSWSTVPTKTQEKATVLDFHGMYEGPKTPATTPGDWGQY